MTENTNNEENCKVLVSIICTIITSGRLSLPFRAHHDDSKYHPKVGEYSTGGVGNFVDFLQLYSSIQLYCVIREQFLGILRCDL